MTEHDIVIIIQQRQRYVAEVAIMQDCLDQLGDADQFKHAHRYAILKRRLTLIRHWLGLLSPSEKHVIVEHLIFNKSWSQIASQIERSERLEMTCDERTLQRHQKRGIDKIYAFVRERFADRLDYLIEDEDNTPIYSM